MAEESNETKLVKNIILGFIFLFVAAIAMAILLPSIRQHKVAYYYIPCLANMRNVGIAAALYASDNDNAMPYDIDYLKKEYLDNNGLNCPGNRNDLIPETDYVLCAGGKIDDFPDPGKNLLLWELPGNHFQINTNCGFSDGHVESLDKKHFDVFITSIQDTNNLLAKLRNNQERK